MKKCKSVANNGAMCVMLLQNQVCGAIEMGHKDQSTFC